MSELYIWSIKEELKRLIGNRPADPQYDNFARHYISFSEIGYVSEEAMAIAAWNTRKEVKDEQKHS